MADSCRIVAERTIRASRQDIFAFLLNLENHWQLADRFVKVVEIDRTADGEGQGGAVRMRGPLGLSRTVRTRVVDVDPPLSMAGTAEIGERTQASVRWSLNQQVADSTRVRLEAKVDRASQLDRLLLLAGGRSWLGRRFAKVLETLEERVAATR